MNHNENSEKKDKNIKVVFILEDETEKVCYGYDGQTLLELAHENGLDYVLEGSCDHSLSCSTCHVILDDNWYDKSRNVCAQSPVEDALLDMAYAVTTTSRLGCQLVLSDEFDGMVVKVPTPL